MSKQYQMNRVQAIWENLISRIPFIGAAVAKINEHKRHQGAKECARRMKAFA